MKKTTASQDAIQELRQRFDYILEESEEREFYIVVGSIGGDVESYRVYEDGSAYCK